MDFYAPVSEPDKTKPLWGENQWPSDSAVPGFKEKYAQWVEKMKGLGMIVMEAYAYLFALSASGMILTYNNRMSVGLGMTRKEWEELKRNVDDSFWVMRIIGDDFHVF